MGMFENEQGDTYEVNIDFIHSYLEDIILDKTKVL